MHFSRLFSLFAIVAVTIAAPLANPVPAPDASPDAAPSPEAQSGATAPSANVRQYVVNAQATIVSLINNFVQSSSPGSNFDSVQSQLSRIAQLTSVSCSAFTPAPAMNAQQAIVSLTQTQSYLNQFNLDLVTNGYTKGSFCSAYGYFRSVASISGRS